MKSYLVKFSTVLLVVFSILAFLPMAARTMDLTESDREIIEAARVKAEELGAELLPLYVDPKKGFVVPAGYNMQIIDNRIALMEGQLIVNAGHTPLVFGENLSLARGECAMVIYNGLVNKGFVDVEGVGKGMIAPSSRASFSKVLQKAFFGNY